MEVPPRADSEDNNHDHMIVSDHAPPLPFPVHFLYLSQELDKSTLAPLSSDAEDSDDLPTVEKLVANTRPAYATPTKKSQRVRDSARSSATLDDAPHRAIKMDVGCESPAVDDSTMPPPPTPAYTEITTDGHTYLEIPSSDSDSPPSMLFLHLHEPAMLMLSYSHARHQRPHPHATKTYPETKRQTETLPPLFSPHCPTHRCLPPVLKSPSL